MKTLINARFWAYINGWVKITLRPGEIIAWWRYGRDEEGYNWEQHFWSLEDGVVSEIIETGGRDCDGRVSSHKEYVCTVEMLGARESEFMGMPAIPAWKQTNHSQRDYAAEAMGY